MALQGATKLQLNDCNLIASCNELQQSCNCDLDGDDVAEERWRYQGHRNKVPGRLFSLVPFARLCGDELA